jgi:N-acetyl-anhydromuramyl-L-alanine amidase AmpD
MNLYISHNTAQLTKNHWHCYKRCDPNNTRNHTALYKKKIGSGSSFKKPGTTKIMQHYIPENMNPHSKYATPLDDKRVSSKCFVSKVGEHMHHLKNLETDVVKITTAEYKDIKNVL